MCGGMSAWSLRWHIHLRAKHHATPRVARWVRPATRLIAPRATQVESASAGDCVGISLRDCALSDVCRGWVALPDSRPLPVASFQATVSVRRPDGVGAGYVALLCVHAAAVPCRFSRIVSRLNKKTGAPLHTHTYTHTRTRTQQVPPIHMHTLCTQQRLCCVWQRRLFPA